ncbi:MAG: 16S rRNA (guanine(527)-N(7))-methyltransferase RsmG [Alphaproteobacteria bacterium]
MIDENNFWENLLKPYTKEKMPKIVSEEQQEQIIERLRIYETTLQKWNKKINLVSERTAVEIWSRHFLDSAQLYFLIENDDDIVVDLGSGGGFPALVLAAFGLKNLFLVESDLRKSLFLKECARHMGVQVTVLQERFEDVSLENVSYITARACAPLSKLLDYAEPYQTANFKSCLFLKGQRVAEEIEDAEETWKLDQKTHQSITDPEASVLEVLSFYKKTKGEV